MELLIKAVIGSIVGLMIHLLSQSKNFFLSGLIPLIPAFTIISHYIIATKRSIIDLKSTIVFGPLSMISYLTYLICVYILADKYKIEAALLGGILAWTSVSIIIILSGINFKTCNQP